jgi:phosphoglycolate phosphatase
MVFWISTMIRFHRQFNPRQIRLVIFDLDGTLIDSRLDLVHSVNAALRHIGRPELPEDVIASYVGDGAPTLIRRALGDDANNEELVRTGLEFFLSYYREHKLDFTTVYDGIMEALRVIQTGRKMAVLTNKPVNPSRAIVEALGLGSFFSSVYGGNSFASKKPDPEGARAILRETGMQAGDTLMVGDSHVDVSTAQNAGLWSCGVMYGFAPHTLSPNPPDLVVDSPGELRELFSDK